MSSIGRVPIREVVERLGGHPARRLGLDLSDAGDGDLARWFLAACLLGGRVEDEKALAAFRALEAEDLATPERLATCAPADAVSALYASGYPQAEGAAARLIRASRNLAAHYDGSFERLARSAEDGADLSTRIARLSPGVGGATVARFLRPLRARWPLATDTPLSGASRTAAQHLGLLKEGQDEEGEPAALVAKLHEEADAPELADVEAALERLGKAACVRGRTERCLLGDDCPARSL